MADFRGPVAGYYARYRRGYPPAVVDAICAAFGLGPGDTAVDLGCGTGQLTLPLARRVRAVAGLDPEPDMLAHARRHATGNVTWVLGADRDLPAIGALLGGGIGAITIGVAVHWMDRDALFDAARPLLRAGGGIAVVTNGAPLWLQDTGWSHALRACIEAWTGRPASGACQTDEAGRTLNTEALARHGYEVDEYIVGYEAPLTADGVIGGTFSAMSADQIADPARRDDFARRVTRALRPHEPMTEHVTVTIQCGRIGAATGDTR